MSETVLNLNLINVVKLRLINFVSRKSTHYQVESTITS